ncbi:uncharacterized protein MKK02DRAFT_39994 [Dioszegia hungarica]|uniref:Fumarylacetoacetase-like C-terminal domain-containing protein n=1 Tax=Dioszegia hungarica TaxID=4972 RepID=A0AA38LXG2_9TREE|nr:uncharacterized protein MKK02DRAFT_39994 [Dioszegia hungarica]KAI9639672.1 hypothetical protein MKK02DRAFT_39994 [Dioszegia hungarica]
MSSSSSSASWQRLIRFEAKGAVHIGEPVDERLDIGLAYENKQKIEVHVLDGSCPWDPSATRTGEVLTVETLLSPISAETVGTVRCTGLSYRDHAEEMGLPIPETPSVFTKPAQSLADPGTSIPIPLAAQDEQLDYEVELAIVIGKTCKGVSSEEAMNYVLGWTCANDLTARKQQKVTSQWVFAKGFDKFCPLGPCIVSTRALPDPHILALKTHVNGDIKQDGSASKMIWPIAHIIHHLSQGTTLPAGTVIITGTPPGIGDGATPRFWLKDGDDVRCFISHGVGTLINKIAYE